ncbi:MAG: dethiobiotin synthetase [Gammaproteobacteria bacterium]|jgi:dethiobiotin synthetase
MSYFVTGTDTGVGKTIATIAIMQALQARGGTVCGMKPVASGGRIDSERGLVSDDALLLMRYATIKLPYHVVNPICLKNPCSPNIAAKLEGVPLTLDRAITAYNEIKKLADSIIVEGVGGWRTPCFGVTGMERLARKMNLPVILVVGVRLGCINHALLTAEAIKNDGFIFSGWIANVVDADFSYDVNTIEFLQANISVPLLGKIPYQQKLTRLSLGHLIARMPDSVLSG